MVDRKTRDLGKADSFLRMTLADITSLEASVTLSSGKLSLNSTEPTVVVGDFRMFLLVALHAFTINCFACVALISARSVCYATHCFLSSLVISDTLFTVCSGFNLFFRSSPYGYWTVFDRPVCLFILAFQGVFCAASEYSLVGISTYRMFATTRPYTVGILFKKRIMFTLIACFWTLPALIWFLPVVFQLPMWDKETPCNSSRSIWFRLPIALLHAGFPLLAILITNIRICLRLNNRQQASRNRWCQQNASRSMNFSTRLLGGSSKSSLLRGNPITSFLP